MDVGVLNCATSRRGTGVAGCLAMLNNIKNFILVEKGWKAEIANTDLDQETIDGFTQSGAWIVLPEHQSIESASEETVYETTDSGYMIYVRDGLVQFLAQYAKGVCFHKALHSISLGNYDLLLVDLDNEGEGRLWGEETPDGFFKGFDLNLANAENFSLPTGSTSSKTPFRVQLSAKGTKAMNTRINFVKADDVDLASLDGVREVTILPVSATGGELVVQLVVACDQTTPITGLTAGDFRVTNATTGAVVTPLSLTVEGNTYTFDLPAGAYNVQLYDTVESSTVIVDGTTYYSSNILNTLVAS